MHNAQGGDLSLGKHECIVEIRLLYNYSHISVLDVYI